MGRLQQFQDKKGLLDKIYYTNSRQFNFYVCGTYTDKEGNRQFTKWKKYLDCVANIDVLNLNNNDWKDLTYFEQINQRQIYPHEIVLDIEDPNRLDPIVEKLKEWDWKDCKIYSTGSRGYHIHVYFNEDFTQEEKEAVVKKLGTDIQKCSEKNLIALENYPHWKTGKLKQEVKDE